MTFLFKTPYLNLRVNFPEIGFVGIKAIFEGERIKFDELRIVTASKLINELKACIFNEMMHTTADLYIGVIYPPIKSKSMKK